MAPFLHIHFRPAAEGLKVELTASPSVWREIADAGGDWSFTTDETDLEIVTKVELPPGLAIQPIEITTSGGAAAYEPDYERVEWDDTEKEFFPRSEMYD